MSADLSAHSSAHSSLPEFVLPDHLPADIAALEGLLQDQHQTYAAAIAGIVAEAVKVAVAKAVAEAVAATRLEAQAQMQRMIEQLILARHRQFGVSSEQLSAQARLFDEAETLAQSSAVIYSLVETAKANGVEPYLWLLRVLTDLPAAKTVDDVEALLPWHFKNQLLADANTA